jgi:hypothetical protein
MLKPSGELDIITRASILLKAVIDQNPQQVQYNMMMYTTDYGKWLLKLEQIEGRKV